MSKLKLLITAVVLVIVFHIATVLVIGDSKIFSCKIASVGGNGQLSEWRSDMCNLHYANYLGSVQKLTPTGNQERIILVYVFPLIAAMLVLFVGTRKINVYMKVIISLVVVGALSWAAYALF